MHKIVILDAISIPKNFPLPRPDFEHEWVSYESTKADQIVQRCQDATIIATNKCKLTKEVLAQLPKLQFIAEMATGFNNIDIDYCKEHNIGVANIQDYSTNSVAEHTFAMLLMLSRSMVKTRNSMENGDWCSSECFCFLTDPIFDLHNRVLTIVGSGNIGKRIGEIAKVFGMQVLKAERKNASSIRDGYTKFEDAIAKADYISVNCPLNKDTTNLIGAKEFGMMKKDVFLVNNARGGVVNEQDLVDAILNKTIRGAASDVASVEPLPKDHPYVKLEKCPSFILTPHQAWMSNDCLTALTAQFKENIEAFVAGKSVRRIV